jgi:hypothetical protein
MDDGLVDGPLRIAKHLPQWTRSIDDYMVTPAADKASVRIALTRCFFARNLPLAGLHDLRWSIQQDPKPGLRHQLAKEMGRPKRSAESVASGVDEQVMIVAIAEQQRAPVLTEYSSPPLFEEPHQNFHQRKTYPPRRHAMRIDNNPLWLTAQLSNHARLQVAHPHRTSSLVQSLDQAGNDRALSRSVGAENYDSQLDGFLCWKRLFSTRLVRSASPSRMAACTISACIGGVGLSTEIQKLLDGISLPINRANHRGPA